MEGLCHFRILLVAPFRPVVLLSGVFFYIPIYQQYYALPCHNFKVNIQEEKAILKMAKSTFRSNIFNGK